MLGVLDKKDVKTIAIVISILLAIWVVVLYYEINEIKKYQPIAILTFPEDEWIKVNDAKIYSFNQAVSPNDQLLLQLNVTNKKPVRFNIEPKIYLNVGGDITKKKEDFSPIQLGIHSTGVLSYNFFASNEGQNNVNVILVLTDFNGTFIKDENSTITDFQVMSTGNKLLSEQNTMLFVGIIISAIGVSSAAIINAYQTKITRDEKNEMSRALIADTGSHIQLNRFFNQNGEIKTVSDWMGMPPQDRNNFNLTEAEYFIKLKNFGQVPAFDAKGRNAIFTDTVPTRRDINSTPFGFPFIMMPTDEQLYFFKIPREIIDSVELGSKKVYFIIEIQYRSGYSQEKKKFGFIAEFSTANFLKIDSWDEKSFNE